MPSEWQAIRLHREASDKPEVGMPCNGCGVCCAATPCPAALLIFAHHDGPCAALAWQPEEKRYRCELLTHPRRHLRWLPPSLATRLFARWIAAGQGCDSDAQPAPLE